MAAPNRNYVLLTIAIIYRISLYPRGNFKFVERRKSNFSFKIFIFPPNLLPSTAAPLSICAPADVCCCYLVHFTVISSVALEPCVADVEDSCKKKSKAWAFRYGARVTSFAVFYELRCSHAS
jgi:hypothetical protein